MSRIVRRSLRSEAALLDNISLSIGLYACLRPDEGVLSLTLRRSLRDRRRGSPPSQDAGLNSSSANARVRRVERKDRCEDQVTNCIPNIKRLEDFDLSAAPGINPATLAALAKGAWIDAGVPVVLIGDSGTGKSHLLIGLGVAACEAGRRVRYVTCAQLVNELAEAADERILSKVVGRYGRLDLLLVDELGYVSVDPRGAELLFQVLTEREERASVAAASNHPFSEWGQTFTDPRLAAAVVDRLTFKAHIIETGTDSYRLRTSRAKKTAKPRQDQP
jgi:DNA replication protein DnaC